ncbi:hypothetical protein EMIT0162MI3_10213 [Pseudomonas chlororaphis]
MRALRARSQAAPAATRNDPFLEPIKMPLSFDRGIGLQLSLYIEADTQRP